MFAPKQHEILPLVPRIIAIFSRSTTGSGDGSGTSFSSLMMILRTGAGHRSRHGQRKDQAVGNPAFGAHPGLQFGHERRAKFLANRFARFGALTVDGPLDLEQESTGGLFATPGGEITIQFALRALMTSEEFSGGRQGQQRAKDGR